LIRGLRPRTPCSHSRDAPPRQWRLGTPRLMSRDRLTRWRSLALAVVPGRKAGRQASSPRTFGARGLVGANPLATINEFGPLLTVMVGRGPLRLRRRPQSCLQNAPEPSDAETDRRRRPDAGARGRLLAARPPVSPERSSASFADLGTCLTALWCWERSA